MVQTSTALPKMGQTVFAGDDNLDAANTDLAQLEGTVAWFSETGASIEGASLRTRASGRWTRCILVRWTGNATDCTAGHCLDWQDGFRGRRVDARSGAGLDAVAAGIVDYKVVGAVAPGDLFWLMVEGYAQVMGDDGDTYAANDLLEPAASGEVGLSLDAGTSNYIIGYSITDGVSPTLGVPLIEAMLSFNP